MEHGLRTFRRPEGAAKRTGTKKEEQIVHLIAKDSVCTVRAAARSPPGPRARHSLTARGPALSRRGPHSSTLSRKAVR